jgi:hypothetical protein
VDPILIVIIALLGFLIPFNICVMVYGIAQDKKEMRKLRAREYTEGHLDI